ncbi:Gfo/Idh/MocA family oxidoreductase [Antarcticibacterium sp. 1MA-6-2]|uniref:Gfo/Idh/MocA family protein n=1 Tax=Antarcticibacterium sp. 1MA-6-2 TaxID=2908210 RepID=UPI001F48EFE5|nr:Gfo/Idh/MocA family oxidoreductase [Antarcticibacterium sp. 1MA-6-2]UJH91514.1 Gfo/Idh/MocA family oxidoreductase [Antarcticibacterium sp. 1MA-6-2]
MQKKTIKWGILGPGNIAHKFVSDLATVEDAELFAVASRSKIKAEEFAATHKIAHSYGSYEAMLKNEELDVVYIATPHVFHYEHTLLCLKHSKAVLCEKPFAMNLEQVKEMISVAKEKNVFLMEALWTYFLPHYKYLLKIVKEETFGKIKEFKADFGFAAQYLPKKRLYNKSLGGGSLLDIGIYPVFAALSLLGRPDEIDASALLCETGVDETCDIKFNYKEGAVAHLSSAINKNLPTTAVIKFEKAVVTLVTRFYAPTEILIQTEEQEERKTFDVKTIGYSFEAEHVQEMLKQRKMESDIMTFDMSLLLIETLDNIRKKINLEYN